MTSPSEKPVNGTNKSGEAKSSAGVESCHEGINGLTNGHGPAQSASEAMMPSTGSNLSSSPPQSTTAASQGSVTEEIPSIGSESSQVEEQEQNEPIEGDPSTRKRDLYVGNL